MLVSENFTILLIDYNFFCEKGITEKPFVLLILGV